MGYLWVNSNVPLNANFIQMNPLRKLCLTEQVHFG